MWDNRVVWSQGDLLSRREEYLEFIKNEYGGSFDDRRTEVNSMIQRLFAEHEFLNNFCSANGSKGLKPLK